MSSLEWASGPFRCEITLPDMWDSLCSDNKEQRPLLAEFRYLNCFFFIILFKCRKAVLEVVIANITICIMSQFFAVFDAGSVESGTYCNCTESYKSY